MDHARLTCPPPGGGPWHSIPLRGETTPAVLGVLANDPPLVFCRHAVCVIPPPSRWHPLSRVLHNAITHRTASLEPPASVPLPSSLLLADGMTVTFPAYLAIFLGTLIPCAFLIILFIQAESRKAGENSMRE